MRAILSILLLVAIPVSAATFPAAHYASPLGTTVSQTIAGDVYDWTFTCGGGSCFVGTFIGGDPWIAPKVTGEQVVLVSVTATTTGIDGGIELNPESPNAQGFIHNMSNRIIISSGNVSAGDTVTIQGTAITFVSGTPTGNEVQIGATNILTATNLYNFLASSGDANLTLMRYGRTSGIVSLVANVVGDAGESYTLTEAGANISVGGATFFNGATYSAALDYSGSLPMTVSANTSIVKATATTEVCSDDTVICVKSLGTLTVLPNVYGLDLVNTFRPGLAGSTKKLYRLADFDLMLLPSDARVTTALGTTPDFAAIHTRWHTPIVDHYITQSPYGLGDDGRAMIPQVVPDYGADIAEVYEQDLLSVMGTDSPASKRTAVTGLIQRGIDLYGSYKAGIRWPSGAGQSVGRKPAIVLFAALVNDQAIKTEIAGLAANNGNSFQEDGQISIYLSAGNVPVWGDLIGVAWELSTEHNYWHQLYYHQLYDGGSGTKWGAGDNQRTLADPYGYIDGPAGEVANVGGDPVGYKICCSTGPFIGFQVAQSLMPSMCAVNNDPVLSTYTRRALVTGNQFAPDSCAPPDARENPSCTPYNWSTTNHRGCAYYGSEANGSTTDNTPGTSGTWGPVLNGSHQPTRQCVQNNTGGNTGQEGRYVSRHGVAWTGLLMRIPVVAQTLITNHSTTILNGCNP